MVRNQISDLNETLFPSQVLILRFPGVKCDELLWLTSFQGPRDLRDPKEMLEPPVTLDPEECQVRQDHMEEAGTGWDFLTNMLQRIAWCSIFSSVLNKVTAEALSLLYVEKESEISSSRNRIPLSELAKLLWRCSSSINSKFIWWMSVRGCFTLDPFGGWSGPSVPSDWC